MSILAKTIDPSSCDCSLRVTAYEVRMKENKPDFVVTFEDDTDIDFVGL
jgi:hypothetical protein